MEAGSAASPERWPANFNIGEAKPLFSSLVDRASRGEQFVIPKAGTPVARIGPLDAVKPKKK